MANFAIENLLNLLQATEVFQQVLPLTLKLLTFRFRQQRLADVIRCMA